MTVLACVFSFGTGIQSLRQTAVTVIPLAIAAGGEQVHRLQNKQPLSSQPLLLTGALILSNLAGVLYAAFVGAPKHEIFGSVSLSPGPDIFCSARNLLALFSNGWILAIAAIALAVFFFFRIAGLRRDPWKNRCFVCLLLFTVSIAVILVIDSFTAMQVRPIYYFLLFPMAATVFVWLLARSKTAACILAAGLLLFSLANGRHSLRALPVWEAGHPLQPVCASLEENGIAVVFTQWNLGGRLAIASDFRIQVGFWDAADDVFEPVGYLCDPSVFRAEPENCAYIVSGASGFALARERAGENRATIHLLEYFPALDLYLFTSDQRLMGIPVS